VLIVASQGTREAFDSLLAIYHSASDAHLKDIVLDQIETLAGRLGLRVRREGSELAAAVG
jgi:hypothetical protein